MLCPVHAEGPVQCLDQGLRNRDGLLGKPQFADKRQKILFCGQTFLRNVASRRREHQVAAKRDRGVEFIRIKPIDQRHQPAFLQPRVDLVPQRHQFLCQIGMLLGIHLRRQHAPEHEVIDAHGLHKLEPPPPDLIGRVQAREIWIEPISKGTVGRIARAHGLHRDPVFAVGVGRQRFGFRFQRHQQVVAQRAVENIGARVRVADARGNDGLVKAVQIMPGHYDLATRRQNFPREQFGKGRTLGLVGGLDRNPRTCGDFEVYVFEHRVAVRVAYCHVVQGDRAIEAWDLLRLALEQFFVNHAFRPKALRHNLPAQRHVLHLVVKIQKLFPRARQILVGRERGHQCADADIPADRQNTPHRVKEERRQLRDEVVEKLHEEFLLINLEADIKQPSQPVRESGQPETPSAVGAQIGDARRRFADFRREMAHLDDALLVQLVDLPLQHRDQPGLQGNKRNSGQPEPDALGEEKDHDDQHLARLKDRLGHRIPHQPAHRFRLRGHHRDKLALRRGMEIGAREAHHAPDQLVAEAPEQTFGQDTLHRVQPHLEHAVHQHRCEVEPAQDHQKFGLGDPCPEKIDRRGLRTDGIVDDPLGQFQCRVKKGKGENREDQQNNLLASGKLPDEREKRRFHRPAFSWMTGQTRWSRTKSRGGCHRFNLGPGNCQYNHGHRTGHSERHELEPCSQTGCWILRGRRILRGRYPCPVRVSINPGFPAAT